MGPSQHRLATFSNPRGCHDVLQVEASTADPRLGSMCLAVHRGDLQKDVLVNPAVFGYGYSLHEEAGKDYPFCDTKTFNVGSRNGSWKKTHLLPLSVVQVRTVTLTMHPSETLPTMLIFRRSTNTRDV